MELGDFFFLKLWVHQQRQLGLGGKTGRREATVCGTKLVMPSRDSPVVSTSLIQILVPWVS